MQCMFWNPDSIYNKCTPTETLTVYPTQKIQLPGQCARCLPLLKTQNPGISTKLILSYVGIKFLKKYFPLKYKHTMRTVCTTPAFAFAQSLAFLANTRSFSVEVVLTELVSLVLDAVLSVVPSFSGNVSV